MQAAGLIAGGAEVILCETCQDPLQAKAAVNGARSAMRAAGVDVPLMVQVTIETTGTMLVGTDIAAAATIVGALDGADPRPQLRDRPAGDGRAPGLCSAETWPGPISVLPNAGLPELIEGETRYPLGPGELAGWLERFVVEDGVGADRRLLRHHGRAHPGARPDAAPARRGRLPAAAEAARGRRPSRSSPRSTAPCRCARSRPICRSASAATPTARRRSASARRPATGTAASRSAAPRSRRARTRSTSAPPMSGATRSPT